MRRHKILGLHAIMLVYLEMDIEHFLETEVEFRCETGRMRSGCYCNVMVFAELASPQILKRIIYSNNEYAQDSFEFILVIRICPISEHTLSKYSLNLFLIPPEGKVTQTCHIDITGFHETIPQKS